MEAGLPVPTGLLCLTCFFPSFMVAHMSEHLQSVLTNKLQFSYGGGLGVKFTGIYWDKLSPQKLEQIRILRDLKKRIEKETGKLLPSGPSENLPPMAARNTSKKSRIAPTNSTSQSHQKLFMWNIGPMTNWRDVQAHITGLTGSVPKVSLFRTSGSTRQSARITFREHLDLVKLIDSIDKSVLHGATVRAKLKDEQPAEVETKVSSANSESHTTK